MAPSRINRLKIVVLLTLVSVFAGGCVYYNTFFNARKAFNDAEKTRKAGRLRGARINVSLYETAIVKSLKIVKDYPNSSYYDDALFVLGVSYYYTKKYVSSERRLRELLANYPESGYAEEGELYLAKAKLELKDEKEAMVIFEKIFRTDFSASYKAEAALALGDYHFRAGNLEQSRQYFSALRDSLGNEDEKRLAQRMVSDSYFESYQFRDALGAYLQILGMEPGNDDRYHALYHSARASFRLMQIERGLDYLKTLAEDEIYFDSLSAIRLLMAEGYEYDDDLAHAEDMYHEVLDNSMEPEKRAFAAYRLGLTYQFDYDDLPRAKEYYDQAVEFKRSSEYGRDALKRSSSIGKIETFTITFQKDSSTTREMVDEAARTQYQLAELYWLELNKLDSAIAEMRYVVDSFPSSSIAPKAMIALAEMLRDHKGDTAQANNLLKYVLYRNAHSDYAPQALEGLGLLGTGADTGYAKLYLDKAEDFLADDDNVDSARYYYQYVADNFPKSKYYVQARFSLIWLTEEYNSPGDSSVYYAYADIVDSFPDTPWAREAEKKLGLEERRTSVRDQLEDVDTSKTEQELWEEEFPGLAEESQEDTTETIDPIESVYFGPNGEQIYNTPIQPIEIREEFVYPVEAYRLEWEGDLYFQIFLDFSGEVVDYILKIRSESEDINREATEAVASMIFDPLRIPQEQQDKWMVYKFQVRKPDHLR
ncbi:MAG: tetratricopeptide repeat protein [candidate division Zixibacteria bacterium]